MTTSTGQIPGYLATRWVVDPAHSDATFTVRHLVSKVRGRFRTIAGEITTGENPLDSSVTITIDADSIDTNNEQRDNHLRTADFLEAATYPTLTFVSTGIRQDGDGVVIDGDLTIKGVTRQVTADLEPGGIALGPSGIPHAGCTATFEINRHDYNVNFSAVLETGGVVVGDKISIQVDIEAIQQQD